MSITAADFKTRFTEFASVDDARINLFIADAVLELNEAAWGSLYNKGLLYLTAHLLQIGTNTANGNSGSVSQVASQSVEGVSISYNAIGQNSSTSDLSFLSTAYGQEYARLKKIISTGAIYSV